MGSYVLLAGAQIAGWLLGSRSSRCDCYCGSDPSEAVLALLGQQLARCGPERLSQQCPPCSCALWPSWAACAVFWFLGALFGGAVVWLLCGQPVPTPALGVQVDTLRAAPSEVSVCSVAPSTPSSPTRSGPVTASAKRRGNGGGSAPAILDA